MTVCRNIFQLQIACMFAWALAAGNGFQAQADDDSTSAVEAEQGDLYRQRILESAPVAWWRLDETAGSQSVRNAIDETLSGAVHGNLQLQSAGPRPSEYPDFASGNTSLLLTGNSQYIVVDDPGEPQPARLR